MTTVALFGAGNVAVGVSPPESCSEMKHTFYSTHCRFAVQLSDGRIQAFNWRRAAGPGGAVLAIEGVSNLLRGRRHGRTGAFSCQKSASVGGRSAIS